MSSEPGTPILLHPDDDVAVLGIDTPAGSALTVRGVRVVTASDIPSGHKVALQIGRAHV